MAASYTALEMTHPTVYATALTPLIYIKVGDHSLAIARSRITDCHQIIAHLDAYQTNEFPLLNRTLKEAVSLIDYLNDNSQPAPLEILKQIGAEDLLLTHSLKQKLQQSANKIYSHIKYDEKLIDP
ncbi:MAG: hypothetical protein Harvfovirus84_1, partial [Harvfovirus sp.]